MEKDWIKHNRLSTEYQLGLCTFLNDAFELMPFHGKIKCPCKRCRNRQFQVRDIVHEHLIISGWDSQYAKGIWVHHGELEVLDAIADEKDSEEEDDMEGMLHDAFGQSPIMGEQEDIHHEPNEVARSFYKLVEEVEQELYPGCKNFNKLSCLVHLFHLKCLNGWTNKFVTQLHKFLKKVLPLGECLPDSFYKAKKIVNDLGLGYNKIDAWPNDCILYRNEFADAVSCHVCHLSRWKQADDGSNVLTSKRRGVAAKTMWHFPLIPRLQRLFMSAKIASSMRWHADSRARDNILRHSADSMAWRHLDNQFPDFAVDGQNVRLGLASDGFNPFGTLSIAHNTWPVILIPYNLPPWMCMNQPFFMMSLLIPGPRAPGNDIDVYLQPLIDELKELWDVGRLTYDASMNENFVMRATILWTINDFPAYANLSGWSTKAKYACPTCNVETSRHYLKNSRKFCYMDHRGFLAQTHRYRRQVEPFDGKIELRSLPLNLTGQQLLAEASKVTITFGKHHAQVVGSKRERDGEGVIGWKKKNIFFSLLYWEHLLIRHNLDVMHIEKNICESLVEHY